MAKTISEWQQFILETKEGVPELAALNSPSKVALWRLWIYVQAVVSWTLDNLLSEHLSEILEIIKSQKAHRPAWYASMALKYQDGHELMTDEDFYDNTGYTDSQVAASKVVAFAAPLETSIQTRKLLRLKLAGSENGEIIKLPANQVAGCEAYINRIKDAGVYVKCTSNDPDSLKLNLEIYYNALVLNSQGQRIDGTNDTPVLNAINDYLKKGMIFNGLFVAARLVDAIQAVDGVVIPHIVSAQARYGLLPYTTIGAQYLPDAGWLRILDPTDLVIMYIPHEPI